MKLNKEVFNSRQILFKEMFVGTLIYAVVLGFFNDYTDIFYANSFSTIFLCALVMQILTYITFKFKNMVIDWLKGRKGFIYKLGMFFSVWAIMFLSKFVFLWVIDFVFGSYVNINNFVGLIAIIVVVTLLNKLTDWTFEKLGKT
jgi:uncharacterized membrane protein YvlD (DUF360 family)